MFKLYRVSATYKEEFQSQTVVGCGTICYTAKDAQEVKERYFYDPKIKEVIVTEERYGR